MTHKPEPAEEISAILERIRSNLPAIYAPLEPTDPQQDLTQPHWSKTAKNELQHLSSEPIAEIYKLLTRATHGRLQRLALGPRAFDRRQGKFVPVDLDETERNAVKWIGRRASQALAERDLSRLRRSIRVLMSLPTSGDRIDADSAEAWLMMLGDLPVWAVERACVDYAARNKWRPSFSDIIERAEHAKRFIDRLARNADMLNETQAKEV